MKNLAVFTLSFLICSASFAVETYFNQNPRTQYKDPYRGITRRGDNLEAVILREVKKAKKSVVVAVQEFRIPSLALLLAEKKKAGLDVRVIVEKDYNYDVLHQRPGSAGDEEGSDNKSLKKFVDVNGNGKIEVAELESRDAIYILNKAKIPLMDDSFGGSMGSSLMHHKFIVIDGKSTVVTTANFTLSCIHGDFQTAASVGNPNSLLVVHSDSFAGLFTEEFQIMWGDGKRGVFGLSKPFRGPRTVTVDGSKITVQFSPTSMRTPYEQSTNGLIMSTIKKARRSFKAALFVFSAQRIADVLEARHDAGVDVGTIIEARFAYRDYSELLDMLGAEMLGTNCKPATGNRVWKNPIREGGMANLPGGDKLHHKFAVVDDRMVIVGSHNWSDAANHGNDESLLVIENTSISDLYAREYDRVLAGSTLGLTPKAESDIQKRKDNCARQPLL